MMMEVSEAPSFYLGGGENLLWDIITFGEPQMHGDLGALRIRFFCRLAILFDSGQMSIPQSQLVDSAFIHCAVG